MTEDKLNYILFLKVKNFLWINFILKELRRAIQHESLSNNNIKNLLITAAVAADSDKIDIGYDVPAMTE